jgi:hypothetical protein
MPHHYRCRTPAHQAFLTDDLSTALSHLGTHDPATETVERELVPQLRARLDVELVPQATAQRRRREGLGLRA